MKLLTVESVDSARQKLLACTAGWSERVEMLPVIKACGRILAQDIVAAAPIPPFRRSTVDGYAVVAADTAASGESIPVFLTLHQAVEMGKAAQEAVSRGSCAYVPTGGMLPEGADAVVMVEHSELFGQNQVAVYQAVAPGSGVVQAGEDIMAGALLLKRGIRIRPQEVGALAAVGVTEVSVYAPITITIISTGDELVSPEKDPAPGEIRDINTYALHALAEQNGYRVLACHVLQDDENLIERVVSEAMAVSDVIAVSGGSSQGKKDMTRAVIERVATPGVLLHGLAIKPGKPTILGYDTVTDTVLAGLPGHPVAALMVFETLLVWLGKTLRGQKASYPVPAKVTCNLPSAPGQSTCQLVELIPKGDSYLASPIFGKSGLISTMTRADGYIFIDMNKEGLHKDEEVLVHLL